jgi:predicted peroxiredoxin
MKKVSIISSTAPAKPRSEKYPVGASVTRTSSGNTVINQGGGEGVDIVKKDDIKSLTDKNVMSSLRALKEFISKVDDSDVTAIVNYLRA